jgi:hypothetical protein
MKAMTMPDLFKRLDILPRHAYPFLWADYVELLCLCSKNGLVSRGNLQAQVQEAQDVQVDADIDGDVDDIAGPDDESAVLDDKVSARWDDIVSRLNARDASYPGWPFQLDGAVLRSVYDEQRADHRLYVALLIASSLRLCVKTRSHEITSAFEEISYQWLTRSLTQFWKVRPFGAHATLPNAYVGTLREKLELLAADINAKLQLDADDYDPKNTGDGGIDLVAWQEIGDQRGNIPVIFGQCACSPTDWESKQLDVTPAATDAHIKPQHPGAAYCFVPHDLSRSEVKWYRAEHLKRVVIVDRLRLLHLFKASNAWGTLTNWSFVADAMSTEYEAAV